MEHVVSIEKTAPPLVLNLLPTHKHAWRHITLNIPYLTTAIGLTNQTIKIIHQELEEICQNPGPCILLWHMLIIVQDGWDVGIIAREDPLVLVVFLRWSGKSRDGEYGTSVVLL